VFKLVLDDARYATRKIFQKCQITVSWRRRRRRRRRNDNNNNKKKMKMKKDRLISLFKDDCDCGYIYCISGLM